MGWGVVGEESNSSEWKQNFASKRTGKALQTMSHLWTPQVRTLKTAPKEIEGALLILHASKAPDPW